MEIITQTLGDIWLTIGQMAPYLLIGYLVAGILSILVTPALVERHLGGTGVMATVKAALFGMPLPLCSCGVIPVTASLRKHGAGRGATASFLISTPTTGVDSIMAAWALVGPLFALYRAFMAVLLGIVGGILANLVGGEDEGFGADAEPATASCCHGGGEAEAATAHKTRAIWRILVYGFYRLPRDIVKPLAVGVIVAGLISALVRQEYLTQFLGAGFGTMLLMLAVGVPLYVCSTASIPLAIGFMALGASPGAALVFLITGPATNAATLAVLWKMIGRRSTMAVLATIAVGALGAGLALDYLWAFLELPAVALPCHTEEGVAGAGLLFHLTAGAFVLVELWSAFGGRIIALFSRTAAPASCCHAPAATPAPNTDTPAAEKPCCCHNKDAR